MNLNMNILIKKIRTLFQPKIHCLKPVSNNYGSDRGGSVGRYYIDMFVEMNKSVIRGNCLEVLNNDYTQKWGTKVTKSDILDIDISNAKATIIGDLRKLNNIPDNTYDCIILTQVLQYIDDLDSSIRESYRILKTNGTLLITLPSVSRIDPLTGVAGDFWRFTEASAKYLFEKVFDKKKLEIDSWGNVYACSNFLYGFSWHELSKKDLDFRDKNFPLIITIKATK
jgi:SAM-dependent methyltransferase